MTLHEAILELNPTVVTIRGEDAFDANDNRVEYDISAAEALVSKNSYKMNRAAKYPSFAEQLDTLYHGGYDAWREVIKAVKDKHPKPESN